MPLDKATPPPLLHHEPEARQWLRGVLGDDAAAQQTAAALVNLSRSLAAAHASRVTPEEVTHRFYQRITQDTASGQPRALTAQAAVVPEALEELREANRAAYASPQARRAHLEVEAAHPHDDPRPWLDTPDGRTRADHASQLHRLDPELRDLYERGAMVAGSAVIVPSDAHSRPDSADSINVSTFAHAVQTFAPLIGHAAAQEKAAEFVTLGRAIAGRTADGTTRLVVFNEYYRHIQRDEAGRLVPPAQQAARLDQVLDEMRPLAAALRQVEPTRPPLTTVSLTDWERGLEARQRDTEHEQAGRLTARLGDYWAVEDEAARTSPARAAFELEREELLSTPAGSVGYERRSFAGQPPRLPDGLTPEETTRLRYETIPALDQQLENGVPVARLRQHLAQHGDAVDRLAQDAAVARRFAERVPASDSHAPVTRADTARALYTLHALGAVDAATLSARGFTPAERAAALDTVGGRLAQDFRTQTGRLRELGRLEQEQATLAQTATQYAQQQRLTPEFQQLREQYRTTRTADTLALAGRSDTPQRAALREQLTALLVNPDTARAQAVNAQQLTHTTRALSQVAGHEVTTADEARLALAPRLRLMRATLDTLAAERAPLSLPRTTHPDTKYPTPLYVARADQPQLRLAVAHLNEYRVLHAAAAQHNVTLETYPALTGPPLARPASSSRVTQDFVRDYLNYRLSDPVTRLRHEQPLFREFATRLHQAQTPAELRDKLKEIRQENYARARTPERYAHETADGTPPRRALNGVEMRHLLLAEAPAHYTPEMREIVRATSLSARAKQEHLQDLAQGRRTPSPALQVLLSEVQRTEARHPAQTARNLNAFLSDYLNPPTASKTRFSRHNLYDLQQQLAPVERDYLYQVIERARHATLTAPLPERAPVRAPALSHTPPVPTSAAPAPPVTAQTAPTVRTSAPEHGVASRPASGPSAPATKLRATLEERITAYLVEVVTTQGAQALASPREGWQHAAQVSRLIKTTLAEAGLPLARYHLTDERLAAVAGQLVGTLPHALQVPHPHQEQSARLAPSSRLTPTADHATPERPAATVREAARAAVAPLIEHESSMSHTPVAPALTGGASQRTSPTLANEGAPRTAAQVATNHQPPDLGDSRAALSDTRFIIAR